MRGTQERGEDPVAAAERELELSRRRLREAHEKVIGPLQRAAEQNNFALIIAASLTHGRGNQKRG
jgi:cellobiose-specific phosphotransferase system component IIA